MGIYSILWMMGRLVKKKRTRHRRSSIKFQTAILKICISLAGINGIFNIAERKCFAGENTILKDFYACFQKSSAGDCMAKIFFSKDPKTKSDLNLYDELIKASRESVQFKTAFQNSLMKTQVNLGDFRKAFRDACISLKAQTQSNGLAGGNEKSAYVQLCEDVAESSSTATKSSSWEKFEDQFRACEGLQAELRNYKIISQTISPCANSARAKLLAALGSATSLGEAANAPIAANARALMQGGYTDGTLGGANDSKNELISACKDKASKSSELKIEARNATECIFKSTLFGSDNQNFLQSIIKYFHGDHEWQAKNSAVQTFLMQIRGLAIKYAATSLQYQRSFFGKTGPIAVPRACWSGNDKFFFENIIKNTPTPERTSEEIALAEATTIKAAVSIREIQNKLEELERKCSDTFSVKFGCSDPEQPDTDIKTLAKALKRHQDKLLAANPALLYDSHSAIPGYGMRGSYLVLGHKSIPKLPAVAEILTSSNPETRKEKAAALLKKQEAQTEKNLAKLCDPTLSPTVNLISDTELIDTLLSQTGSQSTLLKDFISCVQKGKQSTTSDELTNFLGPLATCGTISAVGSATATPVVGGMLGGACFGAFSAATQIPEYLAAVREAKDTAAGLVEGRKTQMQLDAALKKVQTSKDDLIETGVLTAVDIALLGPALQSRQALKAEARAEAEALDKEAVKRAEKLRQKLGYVSPESKAAADLQAVLRIFNRSPETAELASKHLYQDLIWQLRSEGLIAEADKVEAFLANRLRRGQIKSIKRLGGGHSDSFIVEFEEGGFGVFKPGQYTKTQLTDEGAETAAHIMDRLLNLNMTPVTVVRDISPNEIAGMPKEIADIIRGKRGSMQFFMVQAKPASMALYGKKGPKIRLFDYIIDNYDRRPENYLISKMNGQSIAIDHSLSFSPYLDYQPTEIIIQELLGNPDTLKRMRGLSKPILERELGPYLEPERVNALYARIQQALRAVDSVTQTPVGSGLKPTL